MHLDGVTEARIDCNERVASIAINPSLLQPASLKANQLQEVGGGVDEDEDRVRLAGRRYIMSGTRLPTIRLRFGIRITKVTALVRSR